MFDTGSQSSLITESFIQRLGLSRENARLSVNGLSSVDAGITGQEVKLSFNYHLELIKIQKLPSKSFEMIDWNSLKTIQLADPEFNQSKPIDLIIGIPTSCAKVWGNWKFRWLNDCKKYDVWLDPTNSITGLSIKHFQNFVKSKSYQKIQFLRWKKQFVRIIF